MPSTVLAMRIHGRMVAALFFGGLAAVVLLVLTKNLPTILPDSVARQINRNNEGFVVVLVAGPWIQFVRPRLRGYVLEIPIAVAGGLVLSALGLWLYHGSWPGQYATLNESAFSLAVLIPYLQLRRPLPVWAWGVPIGAVAIPAIGGGNALTTNLAEVFGAVFFVAVTVDFVDRGILDGSRVPRARVLVWIGAMVVAVGLMHVATDRTPNNVAESVIRYTSRVNEMFMASAILVLYLSILCPDLRRRVGPPCVSAEPAPDPGRARLARHML